MQPSNFDPRNLEPKDGDFAKLVEQLNHKNIDELKAQQVHDKEPETFYDPQAHSSEPFNELNAHPVMPVPSPTRVNQATIKKVMPVWVFFAFAIIFMGIFLENELVIMSGFFLAFVTIFIAGLVSSFLKKK